MSQKTKNKAVMALGLGMEFIGMVMVLIYAGRYFDRKYELPGYGVTFGGLIALITWLLHVTFVIKDFDKDDESSNPEQK